ncbi:MAG TPA: cation diffusion facilitator family transporter [Polyangia bacterium]|jgi:cobalt-zinc-cadmium efflux system protein|nr:cation diffusion facilitator family transporter [Polyangia bacterium]
MADHHHHAPMADHHHGHSHVVGPRFAVGAAVNFAFVLAEIAFGVAAHSVALVADAAHNFGDVLGLLLAWGATILARKLPSSTHTYGLRKTTLLATLANAVLLLVAVGGVVWEAIQRLQDPEPVRAGIIIVIAAAGVVVNGASALLFMKDRHEDTNVRAAFAHLAADALIAVCVAIAGGLVFLTGWQWLDPVTSLAVSAAVVTMSWRLLKDAVASVIDAVPDHVDYRAVREYLTRLPSVSEVHDLHIWRLSSTETALTAHLVVPWSVCEPTFLQDVCRQLHDRFAIEHSTLQLDAPGLDQPCALAPDDKV